MKKCFFFLNLFVGLFLSTAPIFADFGDPNFPIYLFNAGQKNYHDAACKHLKNNCIIIFQGTAMWVEGHGGIELSQLKYYRFDAKGSGINSLDYHNYIIYESKFGELREALFVFIDRNSQKKFMEAFFRWKRQVAQPIPNYILPKKLAPKDLKVRDSKFNIIKNNLIIDFME